MKILNARSVMRPAVMLACAGVYLGAVTGAESLDHVLNRNLDCAHQGTNIALVNLSGPPAAIMLYECDQEPVTVPEVIRDDTGNTSGSLYWYTPGRPVISTNGARSHTDAAWHFATNSSSYMYIGLNDTVRRIGAVGLADGLSMGFWMKGPYHPDYESNTVVSILDVLRVFAASTNGTGQMVFQFGSINGYNMPVQELRTPADGGVFDDAWHHLVVSLDFTSTNDNLVLYVDAEPVDTQSFAFTQSFAPVGNWQVMYWGVDAHDTVNGSWQDGALDQFIVFDKALTAIDAALLMQEGSGPFVNRPPVVHAGDRNLFSIGVDFPLVGSVQDDGRPDPPGEVQTLWSVLDGPGGVTFADPAFPETTVRFDAVGDYTLRLTADDGSFVVVDDLACAVVSNLPPVITSVHAHPGNIVLPVQQVALHGAVEEDGNPRPPGSLIVGWSVVEGPGEVVFGDRTALSTVASFSEPGRYTLRLTVDDGWRFDDAELDVVVYTAGTAGERLMVDAGSSRSAWLPDARLDLSGRYWNTSGPVTVSWSRVLGPTGVQFETPDALETSVSFPQDGIYVLELLVQSGDQSGRDRLTVTVYPAEQNFGYTPEELRTYFTADLNLHYDFKGFDFSRCAPPPEPHAHPRIFINPEELPGLRNRLAGTVLGNMLMTRIRSTLTNELTRSAGAWGVIYDDLADGSIASFNARTAYDRSIIVADLAYEAFRCLIDEDAASGAKLGAALATVAAQCIADILAVLPTVDYRVDIQELIYRQFIGMAYDWAYPYMTDGQRGTVRQALSLATSDMWSIGMEALPAPYANTSNWVSTHLMHLLINLLAIEGEPGYDENLYPRIVAAYERFLSFGIFRDGATYEDMGKHAMIGEMLIPLAKRGDFLGAVQSAKNHLHGLYAQSMLPWGDRFLWTGEWGGFHPARYVDIAAMKYLYPGDPVIDFMLRNDLQTDYARLNDFNRRFPYSAMDFLMRAIFVEDFDQSKTWDEAAADLNVLPLGYLSNYRGMMAARSDWTAQAVQLIFHPHSTPGGGHAHADRNHFVLNAHGRTWAPTRGVHWRFSEFYSTVRVNGQGSYTMPGRVVEWSNGPVASLLVGDARESYALGYIDGGGGAPWTATLNDYRWRPGTEIWESMSMHALPTWEFSQRSNRTLYNLMPMQRAYRTMALVRGGQPYVLCIDDIQRDAATNQYAWRMQLPEDVSVTFNGADAILAENAGPRRLLVRLLRANGVPSAQVVAIPDSLYGANFTALQIETTAVAPDFVVMLVPYIEGDALPATQWSGDTLSIGLPDGTEDRLSLVVEENGRRMPAMTRNGVDIFAPDGPPDAPLYVEDFSLHGGYPLVRLPGRAGQRYVLERTTDALDEPAIQWMEMNESGMLDRDRDLQLWDPEPSLDPRIVYRLRAIESE